jgi:DNA transformation protein and related proteins
MGSHGRIHDAAASMSNDFIDYLQELFVDFGAVTTRAMFGGHGLYHYGVMFAVAFEDGLYLKVDSQTRALFEAEGCMPFVYTQTTKPLTMSYWSAPAAALDSPQAMLPWARLAFEAALRKPTARTPRKRNR